MRSGDAPDMIFVDIVDGSLTIVGEIPTLFADGNNNTTKIIDMARKFPTSVAYKIV
jgi:hypothetical protein